MNRFDVFNGDADGLCALQQLHLAAPHPATLVTGVKRDIRLLERVAAGSGDRVTVLDISLDSNRAALDVLLERGARVTWFDHHYAGAIPEHPLLESHIDTAADCCTSLLVDAQLGGHHRAWAVVGAFGDNLDASARAAAAPLGLAPVDLGLLRELGVLINYNSYGETFADLYFPPADLFARLTPYADPLVFAREDPAVTILREGYRADMAAAKAQPLALATERHALVMLPAQPWARRVGGVYANALAQAAPARAHALLTALPDGAYQVSVRAPLNARDGADVLCRQFATGGGRRAAAGINRLPAAEMDRFTAAFVAAF